MQKTMLKNTIFFYSCTITLMTAVPAAAQKTGKGGTGIDENTALEMCDKPIGIVQLVEQKTDDPTDQLPPQFAALARLAEQNKKGGPDKVDPGPLLKLFAAKSRCFQIADRSAAFEAIQKENERTGNTGKEITAVDYILTYQILYSDAKSREGGGGIGGLFGSAVGLKTKTLESQVLLSVVNAKTGIQEIVSTGSARHKDVSIIGGGLLLDLGVGALGGSFANTDIGKVSSYAMLDAYRKLVTNARVTLKPAQTAAVIPQYNTTANIEKNTNSQEAPQ
ncbi:MAG: hypothetical protein HC843_04395 [Sphingomonadales bacterium]|nr:hypothetical protein [Sphingomonadales bacterium]